MRQYDRVNIFAFGAKQSHFQILAQRFISMSNLDIHMNSMSFPFLMC